MTQSDQVITIMELIELLASDEEQKVIVNGTTYVLRSVQEQVSMWRRDVETPSNVDNLSRYIMNTLSTPLGRQEPNNATQPEATPFNISASVAQQTEGSEASYSLPVVVRRLTQELSSQTYMSGPLEVHSGMPQEFQWTNDEI